LPRVARTLAAAFGLFGGVVASQGPEFAQQYRQRLGGAIDELARVTARFDEDARATGQTREAALGQLRQSPDRLTSLQGEAMRANIERLGRLERQRASFVEAGPFSRLTLLLTEGDTDLARAAYRDFEPAMPATTEGLVAALIGFAGAYGASRLIGLPLRRLFVRRRALQRA
jgi:Protein of unknown function (DUF2937)